MNAYCTATGKVRFASQHKAAKAVSRVGRHQHAERKGQGNVYRCSACGDWHIAHASPDQLKARKFKRERAAEELE